MAQTVIMPKAGQTMEEGTIVSWLKREGDAVAKGEPIMVIQTDKADLEVEATDSGVLAKIIIREGQTVPVLTTVAIIAAPGEKVDVQAFIGTEGAPGAPPSPPAPAAAPPEPAVAAQGAATGVRATPTARKVAKAEGVDLARVQGTGVSGRIMRDDVLGAREGQRLAASPVAKQLARESGVDLAELRGTGPEGRIIKRDVETAIAQGRTAPAAPAAGAPAPAAEVETIELKGMRKAIASALQLSKQQAPHFYATMAVDMTRAMAFKDYLKETNRKISVNDLVLRAAVLALVKHRKVNCRTEGNRVSYFAKVNLGVAVGLDEGLVVPVVMDAAQHSLDALAQEAKRIATLARSGKLIGMGQGTFTVTNLGMFGVESFQAIINPPEGGILAVGAVTDGIVVRERTISIAKTMKMTLSVDHRVVDGILAAQFLQSVKELLENPERLAA